MDERGDGRRAGHGIRQPDIQGNLGGFPAGADEEQQADRRGRAGVLQRMRAGQGEHPRIVRRAECVEDQKDTQDEAEVADAIDHEGLLAGVCGEVLFVIEADEQVRAETHALPPDEHDDVVRAEHQQQHHEHEEIQVREEARVARLMGHVARGVDVNEESDPRYDHQHGRRERIDAECEVDREVRQEPAAHVADAGGNPCVIRVLPRRSAGGHEIRGDQRRQERRGQSEEVGRLFILRFERPGKGANAVDQRAQRGKKRHQQKQTSHSAHSLHRH